MKKKKFHKKRKREKNYDGKRKERRLGENSLVFFGDYDIYVNSAILAGVCPNALAT